MKINDYSFGRISIDGETYSSDVIIYPDRVKCPWRRTEGHVLSIPDLADVLGAPPRILVIGTGYYGRMKVPTETLEALREQGIEAHVGKTGHAVADFNRLSREYADIIAALHLTC